MEIVNTPTVSVVMPAYNAEKYLAEAINSILAQTYTDFELIIVNDGSTDATKQIILSYSDPRIVYLENEKNSGICVTLNKGLDAARGRYIARMDSDDISLPDRLESQVKYMESHPETGVIGTDIEVFYSDSETTEIGPSNNKFHFDTDPQICKANIIFSAPLAHPTALIRTAILNKNHLRYDDYYRGMEDHHLWWQISKYSEISNLPIVLLRYRQHKAQVTKQTTNIEFRNRLRSFIRQRIFECGAIFNTDELNAFYLYHENIDSYDKKTLTCFISACKKILKRLKEGKVKHYNAQKEVFSRAISFSLDKSSFNTIDKIRYQTLALSKGSMDFIWYLKRMSKIYKTKGKSTKDSEFNINDNSTYRQKKRIALLMYYMNCGGVESAIINLLDKIDFNDFIVDLYLLEAKGEFLDRINKQVNIIDLSKILNPVQKELIITQNIHSVICNASNNGFILQRIRSVLSYIIYKNFKCECPAYKSALVSSKLADFNYDLILDFHGYASFTTFFGAYKLSGTRRLTWCHSQDINFDKIIRCINKYDKMYTVSAEMKSLPSLQKLKIPADVFYNFIDTNKIIESAVSGEKFSKTTDYKTMLTIGRLSIQKGYDIAIETAKILRDKGLNFKWYFCGDGEERDKLLLLVKRYGLTDQIIFMGFKNNPYGYLSSCDIYVQPSRWEGYAVTLMEAKVLHKVIVTTNVSGAKEAVRDGYDGYICNPDSVKIASALESLINNRQLLDEMECNAQNSTFSQDSSEQELKTILGSI